MKLFTLVSLVLSFFKFNSQGGKLLHLVAWGRIWVSRAHPLIGATLIEPAHLAHQTLKKGKSY